MDAQATALSQSSPPEAPHGWSVGWSGTHNRWYFVNKESNLTQWKRPDDASQQPQPGASTGPATPKSDDGVQAPTGNPLPTGWVSQWSQEYNQYYFVNTATGESQWEPPKPVKPRDTATLPSQLKPPAQAKHARSSSQPPLRSGSKSDHSQHDLAPSALFASSESRTSRPASEDEFHFEQPQRPKSHVFTSAAAPQSTTTGIYTPPMWSYGAPESSASSPCVRGRQQASPGLHPTGLEDAPIASHGSTPAISMSPPSLSPRIAPQSLPTVPSALNPFVQGSSGGSMLSPTDISRPSSRSSETDIHPAYSYSPGFTSKYSSYQPAPEDNGAQKRFSAWNPAMSVAPVPVVYHPENYDFLP